MSKNSRRPGRQNRDGRKPKPLVKRDDVPDSMKENCILSSILDPDNWPMVASLTEQKLGPFTIQESDLLELPEASRIRAVETLEKYAAMLAPDDSPMGLQEAAFRSGENAKQALYRLSQDPRFPGNRE